MTWLLLVMNTASYVLFISITASLSVLHIHRYIDIRHIGFLSQFVGNQQQLIDYTSESELLHSSSESLLSVSDSEVTKGSGQPAIFRICCDKETSLSTFLGASLAHRRQTMCPALLNKRSLGDEEAGIARNFRACLIKEGNCFAFLDHHEQGLASSGNCSCRRQCATSYICNCRFLVKPNRLMCG